MPAPVSPAIGPEATAVALADASRPFNSNALTAARPATTPAVAVPSSDQTPSPMGAISYKEKTYKCQAGDTFQSISKLVYGSEDYGKALWQFNRDDHDKQIGTAVFSEGRLAPGDTVYLPSTTTVLQQRYGSLIPKQNTASPPAAAPSTYTFTTPNAAPTYPEYKVRGNDERMLTIATQLLGNENRWQEIAKLNPQLAPEQPLPSGSVVRLPAGTIVPPTNVP
jgi:nucleoid-associated protein YgaU